MAIQINPFNAKAWNNRGWVLFNEGQFETALSDFRQAIEANPCFPLAYYNAGVTLFAMQDSMKATGMLQRAIELDVSMDALSLGIRLDALLKLSEMASLSDQFEDGMAHVVEAIAMIRDAYAIAKLQHMDQVYAAVCDFLAFDGHRLQEALFRRGEIFLHTDRPKEACIDLSESLRLAHSTPQPSAVLRVLTLVNRAAAFYKRDRYNEAIADATEALDHTTMFIDSDSADTAVARALDIRASCRLKRGETKGALRDLKWATDVCPDSAYLREKLAQLQQATDCFKDCGPVPNLEPLKPKKVQVK